MSEIKEYNLKLIGKEEVAKNTPLFKFEKPNNFQFKAGQFGIWKLPQLSPNVEKGNERYFTIACPPHFPHLQIAMRYSGSPFKEFLLNMNLGDTILFRGPQGNFVLPQTQEKPIVFLCGGIGITPAYSMILDAFYKKLPFKFWLFYSNRTPEDSAFLNEFFELSKSKDTTELNFVPTMTDIKDNSWTGEKGFIASTMLENYLKNLSNFVYYIVGPPGFVAAMENMLLQQNVDRKNINLERFVGYN